MTPLGWILAFVLFFVLLTGVLIARRGGGDMIERQKREAQGILQNTPAPELDRDARPHNLPSDEQALVAVPEIFSALQRGRKIEAIKLLRERTGMGLKDAKALIERHQAR